VQAHPKSFDLLKILAKSLKFWTKSLKSEQKLRPTFAEKQVKTIYLEVTPKNGSQKLEDSFLGKFGKF